jgi:hypothetical protein
MRLVLVQVVLLAIGCTQSGSSSPLPGKRPNEVPPTSEAGVMDSSADLSTDALAAPDAEPAPPSPPDAAPGLPPYPRCQVSKYLRSTVACKTSTDRLRTKEGLVCAACDDVSFHQPFPCWATADEILASGCNSTRVLCVAKCDAAGVAQMCKPSGGLTCD